MGSDKFLRQVAAYFCDKATIDNMADLILVVPNRRSGLFLKKHFQKELAGRERPVMLPRFHTMGRLIQDFAQCPAMPRNEQLFLLYEAYCEVLCEIGNESQARDFDRFAFWGDIILNDFNDIDSSLSDASAVFRNLRGLKEIAADFLTEDQKEIVRRLWGESVYTVAGNENFWLHLDKGCGDSVMKSRFIQLWQLLGPLYQRFHNKLRALSLTTEGAQQRMAVEAVRKDTLSQRRYAFIGFSSVTNAEFSLMDNLARLGAARFFWDFGMLPEGTPLESIFNRFGKIASALPQPDDFKLKSAEWPARIQCIAVPSNSGQAKFLSSVLRQWYAGQSAHPDNDSMLDTAVVVPDESLLLPLVMSLPPCVDAVNITMRLPYRSTTFASLLSGIISMQLRARIIHGEYHFFYEDVERILSHPHIRTIAGNSSEELLRRISAEKMYNIAASELQQMAPEFCFIFRPVKDLHDIGEIHGFAISMIRGLEDAVRTISHNNELIEYRMLEYFRVQLDELYRLICKYGVSMSENTYFTLFERLLSSKRIDLHGSPLKGLQMMGVLETRALDFNRVIISSMNERIFPRRNYLRTMIPDNLRRAYGLNTESDADAAYTYYFYRIITGAQDVKLLYDNRSASLGAGEVSRFISQLRHLQSDRNIEFTSVTLGSDSEESREIIVEKDSKVLSLLNRYREGGNMYISASALKNYISCPLRFYLQNVRRLYSDDDVNPYLSAADYGTVVHSVMEALYKPYEDKHVTADIIDSMLNTKGHISGIVERQMSDFLNKDRLKRKQPPRPLNTESRILCKVIVHFVANVLKKEKETYCHPSFRYKQAERNISAPVWEISTDLRINFKMIIDRIDEIRPGLLRFIDYKTGSDKISVPSVDKILTEHEYGAIFQLLLYCEAYSAMLKTDVDIQPVIYNFTSIVASQSIDPIVIGKEPVMNYKQFSAEFMPRLREKIEEIFDPAVPFTQCELKSFDKKCAYCPFADLCGR